MHYWHIEQGMTDLTHFRQLSNIYASLNWVSIDSDNGLAPNQAITWSNALFMSNPKEHISMI